MSRLKEHLNYIFVTVSLALSLSLAGLSVFTSHNHAVEVVEKARLSAARNTADSMAFAMKIGDLHSAQAAVESFYRLQSDGKVVVKDSAGQNVISVPAFAVTEACQFRTSLVPIRFEGRDVGVFEYCYDQPPFQVFNKDIVFGIVLLLVIGSLFFGIAWFVDARTRETNLVLEQIMSIDAREPELKIHVSRDLRAETRLIVDSVQNLISEVASAKEEASNLRFAEQLSRLATQVSHDIRSPLAALNIGIKAISSVPEERRGLLETSIKRINAIADDLLKKGREIGKEHGPVQGRTFVAPVLRSLIVEKTSVFGDRPKINLLDDIDIEEDFMVACSESTLSRIVSNLINNSAEAFGDNGEIRVSARAHNECVSVVVSDNGKGIPPEVIGKVGKRGFSYGKSSAESGSGLGLAHAYEVMHSIGGKLQIQSRIGIGTMVSLSFPKVN